ncbi:hypothetical protein ACFVT1_26975 [Streptomyces sp. NPDC057963]|uniref:hypothetical protein n=1 Tax=Streptomyces sp. NPDC057963 TaxID=3346290 RepID=UPI0036ECB685
MRFYDPDTIVWTLGALLLVVPVIIVAIRQSGATARAKAKLAREQEYQRLAELTVNTQQLTHHKLAEISIALADISKRVASTERALKEIE